MRDSRVYESDGRALLRCRDCGHTGSLAFHTRTEMWAFNGRPASSTEVVVRGRRYSLRQYQSTKGVLHCNRACTACGSSNVRVNVVRGVLVESKPCNAKCMGAIGPACECACGGQNHGGKYGVF